MDTVCSQGWDWEVCGPVSLRSGKLGRSNVCVVASNLSGSFTSYLEQDDEITVLLVCLPMDMVSRTFPWPLL